MVLYTHWLHVSSLPHRVLAGIEGLLTKQTELIEKAFANQEKGSTAQTESLEVLKQMLERQIHAGMDLDLAFFLFR